MMKWPFDKSIGVFRNRGLSAKLRYAALTQSEVFQFAHPMMPVEGVRLKSSKKAAEIKVYEVGRGIALRDLSLLPKHFDSKDPIQKQLIWQIQRVLDQCSANALKASALKVTRSMPTIERLVPKGKWLALEGILGVALGYLSSYCRPYEQNFYVGIGGKELIRRVKRLPSFIPWGKYLMVGDTWWNGEVGLTNNNIRWVQCSHSGCFQDDGVVFGDEGLFFKEYQTPDLRASESMIAWYGQMSFVGKDVLHVRGSKR